MGVTRCRDYQERVDRALSHDAYVELHDGKGLPIDPILLMHVSHGARIERILHGFRPRDRANGGAGVLIAYALDDRHAKPVARPSVEVPRLTGSGVEAAVREGVERVLGASRREAFRPDRPLMDMGLESLDLLELRRSLSETLGIALDPTFFFRYGTPDAVVRYFVSQIEGEPQNVSAAAPATAAPQQSVVRPAERGDGYAIVGMACRLPGADDCSAFWDLLLRKGDAVREIDAERWRLFRNGDYPIDDLPREGALLRDIDKFDASFFHVSPREAILLDPQQRLLLETAWLRAGRRRNLVRPTVRERDRRLLGVSSSRLRADLLNRSG